MMLCSVSDVAAALGREIDDDDVATVSAIERASVLIAAELPDWQWTSGDGIELSFTGSFGRTINIPARNITAVTSVTIDDVVLDEAAWEWNGRRTITRIDGGTFLSTTANVRVVCDIADLVIPPVLATVATQIAIRLVTNPEGIRQEMLGSFQVMYSPTGGQLSMTNDERRLVRQYRQRAFS